MPKIVTNEVFDGQGNVLESTQVSVPEKVIDDATFDQAKRQIKQMVGKYWQNGQPTGTVTQADARNWLLALTVVSRWLFDEMDDEG